MVHHDRGPEVPLHGWVTEGVVRVGETVRRPLKPTSAFVHRLLEHLSGVDFEQAPRFLGLDELGREILSFRPGEVPLDCRALVWRDDQLVASARLLRSLHDAAASSRLAAGEETVLHNDFGPWNLVWADELPVGVIDFDEAAPGKRVDDLAYAAWKHLNLGLVPLTVAEQRRRLLVLTRAYGYRLGPRFADALQRAQERMARKLAWAPIGTARDESLERLERERAWLREHRDVLAAAAERPTAA